MNIIIEGADASGKTTLAEAIKSKFNFGYEHSTSKTANDLNYHLSLLDKDNMVYDRFMLGELIYPKYFNRDAKITFSDMCKIMEKIVKNNDLFIILYSAKCDILKSRLKERNELADIETIEAQNRDFYIFARALDAFEYNRLMVINIDEPNAYNELYKRVFEIITGSNINFIYKELCKNILNSSQNVCGAEVQRGDSIELNNYSFTLNDIRNNVVTLKSRDISLSYLVGELLWYNSGRNDVAFISKFSKFWKNISDDGEHSNSAYGYVLKSKFGFNQIEKIIEVLKDKKNSRRAVMNFNFANPNVIETKDEICTICLQFYIRNNKLNCTGVMRSNDVIFGLTYDITYFTELQKYIANKLGVEYGSYTHFVTSMHGYKRDFDLIRMIAYSDCSTIEERINFKKLYECAEGLINYVDKSWISKEDFYNKLKSMNIIQGD